MEVFHSFNFWLPSGCSLSNSYTFFSQVGKKWKSRIHSLYGYFFSIVNGHSVVIQSSKNNYYNIVQTFSFSFTWLSCTLFLISAQVALKEFSLLKLAFHQIFLCFIPNVITNCICFWKKTLNELDFSYTRLLECLCWHSVLQCILPRQHIDVPTHACTHACTHMSSHTHNYTHTLHKGKPIRVTEKSNSANFIFEWKIENIMETFTHLLGAGPFVCCSFL